MTSPPLYERPKHHDPQKCHLVKDGVAVRKKVWLWELHVSLPNRTQWERFLRGERRRWPRRRWWRTWASWARPGSWGCLRRAQSGKPYAVPGRLENHDIWDNSPSCSANFGVHFETKGPSIWNQTMMVHEIFFWLKLSLAPPLLQAPKSEDSSLLKPSNIARLFNSAFTTLCNHLQICFSHPSMRTLIVQVPLPGP